LKANSVAISRKQLINTDILVVLGFAFLYPATNGFASIGALAICMIILVLVLTKSLVQHIQHYKLTHKIY